MIENFIGNEYIIKDMFPIRPLMNFLWNEKVIASYNQFGFGEAKCLTETGFRIITNGERLVYIKENNEFYDANRNYKNLPFDKFETHVGLNYQTITSSYKDLEVSMTLFIPSDDYVEISHIHLKNNSKEKKVFDLYFYNKPFINLTWHGPYSKAYFDKHYNSLVFSHIGYDLSEKNQVLMLKSNIDFKSFEVSDINFKGIYNDLSSPKGLYEDQLSNTKMTFDGECSSAIQFKIELNPNEEKDINIVCAVGKEKVKTYKILNKYLSNENYFLEREKAKKENDEINKKIILSSNDKYLDKLINIWLKRQINLGKTWGRVYGKGFRDVMQDISSFLVFDYSKAKEKIISTLKYQFENGNTIRQFEPILDYPYQDGAIWISDTILSYLKETNDFSILDEVVSYYNSSCQETVFLHMKKGLDYLYNNLGQHHLVKWGGGDWNDSLNACGLKGIGESVWLSIALVKSTNSFIEICKKINFDYQKYLQKKEKLEKNIIKYGFENDQYIYGYNDLSQKIGSSTSKYGKIYLNPQTWSILANIQDEDIQKKVMKKVEKKLSCKYGYVQLRPSYRKGDDNIGRTTYFSPGTYENGSSYNHGVAFKIASNLLLKQPNIAYKSLKKIYPLNHKESGMEEYAIGNMYFGIDAISRIGFAPMPWITGTSGWIFKDVIELMCGIKPDYDGLIIDPCLPNALKNIYLERVYQGTRFKITIKNTGKKLILVDNKINKTNKIPLKRKKEINVIYEY